MLVTFPKCFLAKGVKARFCLGVEGEDSWIFSLKICDLEFTVIGDYTAITDFIYVLEDDDRFAFEISKFKLSEPESGGLTAALPSDIPSDLRDNQLQATFVVKSLPINASTISATYDETKTSSEESTSDITDDIYDELY